jgi:hypothetical protein
LIDSASARLIPILVFAFFLAAFLLYHLMVFRVNKHLTPGEKFLYPLPLGQMNQLTTLYKSLYPKSIVYHLTLVSAVTMMLLAIAFVALRIWRYAEGNLP